MSLVPLILERVNVDSLYLLVKRTVSVLEEFTDSPKSPHQSNTTDSVEFSLSDSVNIFSVRYRVILEDSSLLKSELTARFHRRGN